MTVDIIRPDIKLELSPRKEEYGEEKIRIIVSSGDELAGPPLVEAIRRGATEQFSSMAIGTRMWEGDYTIGVDEVVLQARARDLAGNIRSTKPTRIRIAPPPIIPMGILQQFWWLVLLAIAAVLLAAYTFLRRRSQHEKS